MIALDYGQPRLSCFKAYDIRGRVPDELNTELAYRIGRAYARTIKPKGAVAVGRDIRSSSPTFAKAVIKGLNDEGIDTQELGLCGTELVYYASSLPGMGGGIMVTASHNPIDYNGMKLVREEAKPVSGDTGLSAIEELTRSGRFETIQQKRGINTIFDITADYVLKVLSFVDIAKLSPLHLVVNAGNGCAGPAFDAIVDQLPFRVTRIHHTPDDSFPNGIPNPLLPENREVTAQAVLRNKADIGIAWDGDFDRCFVFDEQGRFVEGYFIVGLLAAQLLERNPGQKIIHDPRLTWNTKEMVDSIGGMALQSKTGHAFIKERMRQEDALYGGEMSAHHYFRDFSYCDSGMIPWLLVLERMGESGKTLSQLVEERMQRFPVSGEINRRLRDPETGIKAIETLYKTQAIGIDYTDGLSMEFPEWRFNLRMSNTEPLVRLNVESRGDESVVRQMVDEILTVLDAR